jgi:hypothetical protein
MLRGALAVFVLVGVVRADDDVPPRRKGALLAWLTAGTYRAMYVAEPAAHASAVHGQRVRTWYSPTLVDDLRAGRTVFRKRAAMVKELDGGGWAVMRKVRRRSGPRGGGWFFYETLDATGRGAYFGCGLAVCAGCHRDGTDFLRSSFRP